MVIYNRVPNTEKLQEIITPEEKEKIEEIYRELVSATSTIALSTLTNSVDEILRQKTAIVEPFLQRMNAIQEAVRMRYITAFDGNEAAIISDVKEILEKIGKNDFLKEIELRKKSIPSASILEEAYNNMYEPDAPEKKEKLKTIPEHIKRMKKTAVENFENCYEYLYHHIEDQVKAMEHYGFSLESLSALIEEKASMWYTPKKKIKISDYQYPIRDIPDFEEQFIKYSNIGFNTIRQGIATNTLTKIKPNTKRNTTIDPITGTATVTHENFTITIPNFTKLANLKTSTYQLLDALTVKLTETGAKSPIVTLSLEEYMKKRKIKDKKEAREQAKADLEILFNAQISFKEKRKKGKAQDFHDIRIIDGKGIKNGIMTVSFGPAFYNILLGYPVMPYPAQLFTLNSKRNPNSFYLLKKITEHKNMNVGKKNEDIIAVKTLLSIAPDIPSYDEVMKADRHIDQRIIKPFERDMDALSDTIKWTYCHSNNTPLTDEELKSLDYSVFITLLIKTEWNEYPDQTARLERKAERQEQAKQKKKKTTAKAT